MSAEFAQPAAPSFGIDIDLDIGIDIAPLLAPALVAPPGGVALEYDAAFLDFEALLRGKPERQFDTAAEEPPWREIMARAALLLTRSKDLRVALGYTRAAAHVAGVGGLHAGLRLLLALFDTYWDTLHPALDLDDDDDDAANATDTAAPASGDPALRINALAALADPYTPFAGRETLLHDLRMAELCRVRGERLLVRDVLIAQGKLQPAEGEAGVSPQHVQGMLADALSAAPHALDDALALPAAVEALASRMSERFGADRAPGMATLMSVAQTVASVCRAAGSGVQSGSTAPTIASPDTVATPAVTGTPATPAAAIAAFTRGAQPASREDAIALLDAVCAFLERTEPANPAPLLIRRARSLMGKDFLQIMEELAPDGLAQVHLVAGTRP